LQPRRSDPPGAAAPGHRRG